MTERPFSPIVRVLCLFLFIGASYPLVGDAQVPKLLLSEIRISGGADKPDNDFVEIHNPGDTNVSLDGWRLARLTSTGTEYSLRVFPSGMTIAPHGYFVWANSQDGYAQMIAAQTSSTATISENNTVLLCSEVCSHAVNVSDKVGFGTALQYESTSAPNPIPSRSLVRKATNGILLDTDNNQDDFEENCKPSPGSDGFEVCAAQAPIVWNGPKTIRLNEVFPDPKGDDGNGEFIETYNYGVEDVDLSGWTLRDATGGMYEFPSGVVVPPGYYSVVTAPNIGFSLNNDRDTISVHDPNGVSADSFSYESTKEGYSWSCGSSEGWLLSPHITSGAENIFDSGGGDSAAFATVDGEYTVRLNEVLPDPKGEDKSGEYVELYNYGESDIDLFGWVVHDASKDGKTEFKDHTRIAADGYMLIRFPALGFALNNSKESLTLSSPDGQKRDEMTYDKSKEGVSWNYNGKSWKMSSRLTPAAENSFEKQPKVRKVKIPKTAFKNVYADFSVETKGKVKWDFGDGRTSTLKETRHKYEKTGTYKVTLRVAGKSEDYAKTVKIKVGGYPKKDAKISEVLPNPEGNDTGNEYVVIDNLSDETLRLKGWSIFSGSSREKASNHPIVADLNVEGGGRVKLTNVESKFTLPNEKGYVELRSPDGQTVHSMEYGDGTIVGEEEIFVRVRKNVLSEISAVNGVAAATGDSSARGEGGETSKTESVENSGANDSGSSAKQYEIKPYCEVPNNNREGKPVLPKTPLREERQVTSGGDTADKESSSSRPSGFFNSLYSGMMNVIGRI